MKNNLEGHVQRYRDLEEHGHLKFGIGIGAQVRRTVTRKEAEG